MKTIHKFKLSITDEQIIQTQGLGKMLCVQVQNDEICLWAEAFTTMNSYPRKISIIGTGNPMSNTTRNYIGTVQLSGFMWHVYEVP